MNGARISVIGIGLRYPDAVSPGELWENVLAGRRAFRRLPDERMNHADYYSPDPAAPDRFYSTKAAVLRDYEFDRVGFKIAGSTYRATDLTHWLALDVAAQALADAGFPNGEGLPRHNTGVVIGNSLTGEFTRAGTMRLRWPYVRRTVAAALAGKGWDAEKTAEFLRELEVQYKAPFAPIGEDSLAGGLANTIAGRLCNYFDLGGGGYTVDGACSSSLLSVATAANALANGEIDAALAGGVDLSIDPFEVIGFAKTGALATGEMKVYDQDSNGFWPGEGAGILVLAREEDALAWGARIYGTIAGWGISSDGKGGITRPEAQGHQLALRRAYRRAGYGVETVSYFEGHGTGTAVGDATEIDALSGARRQADPQARPAALSTIKGNIGHTKAAAGVAGLIKATLAVHHQVIPPGTGQFSPHPRLADDDTMLYVPQRAELWPEAEPIRAGVSAMGFGGINTHIAVEQAPGAARRTQIDAETRAAVTGRQDVELLLFDGETVEAIRDQVSQAVTLLPRVSFAEMADVSAELAKNLTGGPVRAAVVVTGPDQAVARLTRLSELLAEGHTRHFGPSEGLFIGDDAAVEPAITFLFPGQGSGRGAVGAIRRRFPVADEVFQMANLPVSGDQVATDVAQPRIVAGSLAAVGVLRDLGIEADAAVGHSLGELTALAWGGALGEADMLRLAATRGRVMADASEGGGAMAGLAMTPQAVENMVNGEAVVIAGYNAPTQTVISGPADAVDRVCDKARSEGITATRINVSHAFHSPLVSRAADAMAGHLAKLEFQPVDHTVVSTVTAQPVALDADLRALLRDQVLAPVHFDQAAALATRDADLVVEVGPGRVLSGLLGEIAPGTPVLATDTDSASLSPLFSVVAAAFVLGAPVRTEALYAGRAVRPISLTGDMTFLASPCETAPEIDTSLVLADEDSSAAEGSSDDVTGSSTLELLCKLAAERVELPQETVQADTHPLDDLHLSSITVGQLVNEVTRQLGRPPLAAVPNFATVRLGELAELIDDLADTALDADQHRGQVPGVAPWVRPFSVNYIPAPPVSYTLDIRGPVADWVVFSPPGHPMAEPIHHALSRAGIGDGVLLCLPESGEQHVELILAAGKSALEKGERFVVVQHRLGASGLARTLHLEAPSVRTTVITTSVEPSDENVRRIVSEVAVTSGFSEVRIQPDGTRLIPVLTGLEPAADTAHTPLDTDDVVLVTGGGKGITAECALALAKDWGVKLALIGRADPAQDDELAANLSRFAALGVQCRYERADVTSDQEVTGAVEKLVAELGPVTAVLHGAGRNEPAALGSLTAEHFRRTLAPKIDGLRSVLGAVDGDSIKLLITFGSIIGRAGLRGEAHYACANDWMTELTEDFQREHPNARALALEWSVWAGAGMGERLGVVEALMRDGITPIATEDGVATLKQVLTDRTAGPVLVVSGRTGGLPTLRLDEHELPLRRFLDRVVAHYPGIELITEADLSAGSDLYLNDHLLDGDLLFPAVIGMEAMTQVAGALLGQDTAPTLENVEFRRPIVVSPGGSTTIRIAALVREPGVVEVVIRSEETGFSADHFRAVLRFQREALSQEPADVLDLPAVPLDPVADLYGSVLFQGKRFQQLSAYRRASARNAVAEISTGTPDPWFAPYLPQAQVLADPGARDTAMHALQCCVPDATLLPESVESLYLADPTVQGIELVVLDARERSQVGDSYTYDIDLRTPEGVLVERWEGLTLRAVRKRDGAGPWVPALLGSYLERTLERVLGGNRAVVVEPDPAMDCERRTQTQLAVSRALGRAVDVRHRPDGKPEVDDVTVTASHAAGVTFAVVGHGRLGCDVESVVDRSESSWRRLLGRTQLAVRDLIAADLSEPRSVAGTRVWSAIECLRKAGTTTGALTVTRVDKDGWAVLSAGDTEIATWVTTITGSPDPVVFAVLAEKEH